MENKWVNMLKEDMQMSIENVTLHNIELSKDLINMQWKLMDSLEELYRFKKENNLITKEVSILDKEEEKPSTSGIEMLVENTQIIKKEEEERIQYLFERKIRGGWVSAINGFVPEGIVRKLGLEHGDMVYAIPLENHPTSSNFFKYEIAVKGNGKDSADRKQYNYCPVKRQAGRLVVDKSEETGEMIRFGDQEEIYTAILDENEVQEHKITEGSLIDIAFPIDKPEMVKVLWIHPIEEFQKIQETTTNLTKPQDKKEKAHFEQTLENKTILLIGNEPKKSLYQFEVEQRGGTFLWADGKEKAIRLEPLVKKADMVVFLLSVSAHIGMEQIKQLCKDYNVPFETTWSLGKTNLIRLSEGLNNVVVN